MLVRCGACRNQFDVPGPGRFTCPICGSVNAVRAGGAPDNQGGMAPPAAPAQRPPDKPSPRITCQECDFSFIVGQVAEAKCPNCGAAVATGLKENSA